jgi:hypothetical protein
VSAGDRYGTEHRKGCGCGACAAQAIADAVLSVRGLVDDIRGMAYEAIVEVDAGRARCPFVRSATDWDTCGWCGHPEAMHRDASAITPVAQADGDPGTEPLELCRLCLHWKRKYSTAGVCWHPSANGHNGEPKLEGESCRFFEPGIVFVNSTGAGR